MKFSILTATYNRAKFLKKLYASLLENVSNEYDIEWLIMDDGSTDDTEEVCKFFVNRSGLEILYYKQDNQGKMQAINNLMEKVNGDFVIECDSDDYFLKNSLKIVYRKCKILQEKSNLYALIFLRDENNKNISGKKFEKENQDTTMFDLYYKQGMDGEKIIVYKSDIRKKYKYIIEDGERFCTEARLHHRMDLDYNVRCYNEYIVEGDYHSDGYSKNINKIFKQNPKGYYEFFKEIFEHDVSSIKWNKRLYIIKHFILFSVLTNHKKNIKYVKGLENKMLYIMMYIPGKIKTKRWCSTFE